MFILFFNFLIIHLVIKKFSNKDLEHEISQN